MTVEGHLVALSCLKTEFNGFRHVAKVVNGFR
jgi:hypothetical protein